MTETQNIDYAQLELIIKKEQEPLKKGLTQNFISKLSQIINDAYESPKNKKDNFICKENTKSDLLKLFQSTKMFKDSDSIFQQVRYLAVAEKDTKEIGKIIDLNIQTKTVLYLTYNDQLNKDIPRKKSWGEVYLFDYNSPQLEAIVIDYKRNNPSSLNYFDIYSFLSTENYIMEKQPADFGKIIVKSEETPGMKAIMEKYDIPLEAVAPPKRKLHCLDANTLEIIGSYDSVKEASEKLAISASTISNVLCQGKSAQKYIDAGNFKWEYSDQQNFKYKKD